LLDLSQKFGATFKQLHRTRSPLYYSAFSLAWLKAPPSCLLPVLLGNALSEILFMVYSLIAVSRSESEFVSSKKDETFPNPSVVISLYFNHYFFSASRNWITWCKVDKTENWKTFLVDFLYYFYYNVIRLFFEKCKVQFFTVRITVLQLRGKSVIHGWKHSKLFSCRLFICPFSWCYFYSYFTR
jgi:hypothetical protein